MANVRITTNTTGTQPVITIGTGTAPNITLPFVQDLTITNKTGVYSYVNFTDVDTRKLSTPADNEISTNIVLDKETFFGNSAATANSAAYYGVIGLSGNKIAINFGIFWAGNAAGSTDIYTTGSGFITSLAPVTKPDAPVWVTPMAIAVDGSFTTILTA